jgi:hypothetical protein
MEMAGVGEGSESGDNVLLEYRQVFHISTDSTAEGIEVASEYSAEEFVIACTERDHKTGVRRSCSWK